MENSGSRPISNVAGLRQQGIDEKTLAIWREIETTAIRGRLSTVDDPVGQNDEVIAILADMSARIRFLESVAQLPSRAGMDVVHHAEPPYTIPLAVGEGFDASIFIPPFNGLYPLEHDPSGRPFRWSGPSHEFGFTIQVDRHDPVRVETLFAGALRDDQYKGLGVMVDSRWITSTFLAESAALQFTLPPRQEVGMTNLLFVVPQLLRPVDLGMGQDQRPLGVCFHALRVLAD